MKFWNKAGNDIEIYGDITATKFYDESTTAKEFAEELKNMKGKITLHINSPGGDVFSALTIANIVKNYDVTCIIEGICASAATLISSACKQVKICNNALFMIHNPMVGLYSLFNEKQLAKISESLKKIKSSIVKTYQNRTGKSESEIEKLMEEETWYNAEETVAAGFADEVEGEIDAEIQNNMLIVNKLSVDFKEFNREKIERVINMDKNIVEKLKALLNNNTAESIRQSEMERIKTLNSKRGSNSYINALIDVAIKDGQNYEEIEKYVNALNEVKVDNTANEIIQLITDNLNSGAENVTSSPEEKVDRAKAIAEFANKL